MSEEEIEESEANVANPDPISHMKAPSLEFKGFSWVGVIVDSP